MNERTEQTGETFSDPELFLALWGVASSQLLSNLTRDARAWGWHGRFDPDAREGWDSWREWVASRLGHELAVAFAIESDLLPVRRLTVAATHLESDDPLVWFGPELMELSGRTVVIIALDLGEVGT